VPAYNAAVTLDACLAALSAGACRPTALVVVDDASTDDTAAIAARHGARVLRLERRSGAAAARNAGAAVAGTELLFFTDADVIVRPDTLARALATLRRHPQYGAVFGSYSAETVHANFSSVYKNLVHHLTHQAARPEATTFWGAAGLIRADVFWDVGGFDAADTQGADVEDVALGYRLTRAGYRIRLDREVQVTHAKRYSLRSLVESDLLHRAIPWTRLMLRERIYRRDLNTSDGGLASALVVLLWPISLAAGAFDPRAWAASAVLLVCYLALNRRLFAACARHGGVRLLLPALGMTALYYVYATLGALVGLLLHVRARGAAAPSLVRQEVRYDPS